jgi:hypothetical protein
MTAKIAFFENNQHRFQKKHTTKSFISLFFSVLSHFSGLNYYFGISHKKTFYLYRHLKTVLPLQAKKIFFQKGKKRRLER